MVQTCGGHHLLLEVLHVLLVLDVPALVLIKLLFRALHLHGHFIVLSCTNSNADDIRKEAFFRACQPITVLPYHSCAAKAVCPPVVACNNISDHRKRVRKKNTKLLGNINILKGFRHIFRNSGHRILPLRLSM